MTCKNIRYYVYLYRREYLRSLAKQIEAKGYNFFIVFVRPAQLARRQASFKYFVIEKGETHEA